LAFFVVFWLLLLACLTNHAALYEQRGVRRRHASSLLAFSMHIPAILIAGAAVGAYLYYAAYETNLLNDQRWMVALIAAFVPFGAISIHRTIRWTDNRLFTFRARSYFPALATCLPAFIIGYYLENGVFLLTASGSLILILWFASVRLSVRAIYSIQLFLLLAAIALFLVLRVEQIGVWILGMFLTLATGVSEAWRVTTRVVSGVEYRPAGLYTVDEQRSFLSGTNIATALFLPLFLTTYLHPQTESSYLPSVMIWVLIGSLTWFRYGPSIRLNALTVWVFVFGTSLPLILAFAADAKGEITLPTPPLERLGTPYTIMAGLLVVIGLSLRAHKKLPKGAESLLEHYAQPNHAIALTGAVSASLALLGFIAALIMGSQSSRYDRFNWLILIYIVFSVTAACWQWWVDQPGPETANVDSR
jgi:hypothetical protein